LKIIDRFGLKMNAASVALVLTDVLSRPSSMERKQRIEIDM
jgi:hypothetical protein